ncbi:hypothetical protein PR048_002045 [Dryococelus australis]|uniref:DUF4371 domain-containing protein n=1 Tax=Dryococelus australis TaxID=614101 RepID=A0ABQ9IJ27_9NEOP|nr:hypothetical protein PR048_002045 [Dryococelus australis]
MRTFLAKHNLLFNMMEHFTQLITSVCPDSIVAKSLACKRTKATSIITNVTGKYSSDELNKFIQENKFSIIVHESPDKGCTKHFCLVARIVNDCTVSDAFLRLIPVEDASADSLCRHMTKTLTEADIPHKDNMIGFAYDGANMMTNKHNSLSTKLT